MWLKICFFVLEKLRQTFLLILQIKLETEGTYLKEDENVLVTPSLSTSLSKHIGDIAATDQLALPLLQEADRVLSRESGRGQSV